MDKTIPSNISKETLLQLKRDLSQCRYAGQLEYNCNKLSYERAIRNSPLLKDLVYPWSNYDWNYANYTDNNYNQDKTGISEAPTIGALFKNISGMTKINNGFIKTANPGKNAISGISDIDQCQKGSPTYKGCNIINNIKNSMRKQSPPYPDAFFKRSLIGENSSSYFIRTGNCEKSNLSEKECKSKKYSWVSNPLYKQIPDYLKPSGFLSGKCFKPKYTFIKNKPGLHLNFGKLLDDPELVNNEKVTNNLLKNYKGEIPSIISDVISLNPLLINEIMNDNSTQYFSSMKCEPFQNMYNKLVYNNNNYYLYIYILIILCTIIIIIYKIT